MLQNLHVRNLALIDECEVDFTEGLNILSGETGAGKSIIIGSVALALGEKAAKEMLRNSEEAAFAELVFYVDDPEILQALQEMDIDVEDDHMIILSRKITPQRAIGRINGEAVSVSKMKAAASLLIDIHGQHEHQSLLTKKNHLKILDSFGGKELEEKKKNLSAAYRSYRKLQEEYENSSLDSEQRSRELSFLEYEVEEIENAGLKSGEDEELEILYRRLANGRRIMEAAGAASEACGQGNENAADLIGSALRELGSVSGYDQSLASLEQQLSEIDELLSDFNRELSSYLSDADFDEETLYQTEKRLDEINHLKSKYGKTIEIILQSLKEKKERIAVLQDYDAYLEKLTKEMKARKKELTALSEELSDLRKQKAAVLVPAITESLKDLNFLDVRFTMEFGRLPDFTANGFDDAEFMISTNPGEPVRPLEKIASGGELSRIMLAIKTVMAENDHIDSLIFDEIDTGISGRTAQMVSEKMNALSRKHQIICITHLPQIAAMADTHFLIEKSVEDTRTVSHIRKLNHEESICELARMLGGVRITDTVINSAEEMKNLAARMK